jgi:hypothetical protein
MAFDPAPSTWLGAGYDSDSGAHTITFNTDDAASNKTLPLLTDALGDPTTGDIRSVAIALVEALYQAWLAQSGSQPTKMTISRGVSTGSSGTVSYSYSLRFTTDVGAITMSAE